MVLKQKLIGLNGDEAVAYAAKASDVDVVAAYPITPQTIMVEKFSEFVHDGETDAIFVSVESEHSAMSVVVGASAAGARTFTASAANGLQLMNEVCYIAAGLRQPIVMAIANRAVAAPINIHNDWMDSHNLRDSGWIQIFTEDAQEAYDMVIQAYRIGEDPRVQLPVMVMLDGFLVSHTMMNMHLLPDEEVQKFLGERKIPEVNIHSKNIPFKLDPNNPLTMGALVLQDYYFEIKRQQIEAMTHVPAVVEEVNSEYAKLSGRSYGNGRIESFMMDDAEIATITLGSNAGTTRSVIKKLREDGIKAGLVKIRTYRPFPEKDLFEVLKNVSVVGIMERGISYGHYGQVYTDLLASFYDSPNHPIFIDYLIGLGGRDMPPQRIKDIYKELQQVAQKKKKPQRLNIVGVRE